MIAPDALHFHDMVCRGGIHPVTVRDYLPPEYMRVLVLMKKGWWLGQNWRVMLPGGQVSRFNAVSFHGPKGEFQPDPPAEVLSMTRREMVEFLFLTGSPVTQGEGRGVDQR